MREEEVKFKCGILRNVFSTEDFKIYAVSVDEKNYPDIKRNPRGDVTIKGELPELNIHGEYEVTAVENNDSRYGYSYTVSVIRRNIPLTPEATKKFLHEILTDAQADTLYDNYPNILQLVKDGRTGEIDVKKLYGIGDKTIGRVIRKIEENFYLSDLVSEFAGVISFKMLKRIYEECKSVDVLKDKLKKEPYSTLTKMSGIGFKIADNIILQLQNDGIIDFGCDIKTSYDRCLACAIYTLKENEKSGNTKMNLLELRKQINKLTPSCAHHFVAVMKSDGLYYNKETLDAALRETYEMELKIANAIKYGLSVDNRWDFDWKQYQNKGEFSLSDEQIELLHGVCDNNVTILTGGAGMGKSFSVQMLIEMLKDNCKTFVLATPTGKSSKILKDFSGVDARTIHRALEFKPGVGWGYNENNKVDCDMFLIDELSMVSVELMSHVIDAIDFNKTKLVMIGDSNQLPSVQCGNLLHDFVNSGIVPIVRLTKVFRYGTGGILTAATDIVNGNNRMLNGEGNVVQLGSDKGYNFIKANDSNIVNNVVSLYAKLISKGYKPEDIAVLTAYNKGEYGAVTLNKHLQAIANKAYGTDKCIKYGDSVYYIDDIVMQRTNDYNMPIYNNGFDDEEDAFVANGECSKVLLVNKDFMVCDFDGIKIKYDKDKLQNLSLAYSYSIHKSQGSTVKIVIVVTPKSHTFMNTMNLLYVAVTRASDKCFHFGLPSTVNIAMKKKENFNRKTFMHEMLSS